jgi:hypothetical protein
VVLNPEMPPLPQPWRFGFDADDVAGAEGARSQAADARPAGDRDPCAVMGFDPELAARAIVFHMIDEGLANGVKGESVRRLVARLRRRGLRPAIRRGAWQTMTNHERLEWLLAETLTVPLMRPDDDVVTLESRDGR